MIECVEQHLGKKAVINQKPFHKADMLGTWATNEKARKLLGWEPHTAPDEGFKQTVDWYIENRDWVTEVAL